MAEPDIVRTTDENRNPFSFDFGSELARENLPAEKRTELAVVAQSRRLDLAEAVAQRTIRLQASSADMDQTLRKAEELARVKGDFVIRSSHETASGRTEITVRGHSPLTYVVLGVIATILLVLLIK